MSIEAMKQALEALEWNLPVIEDYGDKEQLNRQHKAITALRERLAQPEQEPVAWMCSDFNLMHRGYSRFSPTRQGEWNIPLYTAPPKQEPVAWANSFDLQNFDMKVRTGPDLHHTVPLYTAPPKQWVGLTDEEKEKLVETFYGTDIQRLEAVEAKLKEKNT